MLNFSSIYFIELGDVKDEEDWKMLYTLADLGPFSGFI